MSQNLSSVAVVIGPLSVNNFLSQIFHDFFCCLQIFVNIIFFKIFFWKYHQCQTAWIQIRPDRTVRPDLDPNCLQISSADDKIRHKQAKS